MEKYFNEIQLLFKLYPNKSFFSLAFCTFLAMILTIYLMRRRRKKKKKGYSLLVIVPFLIFVFLSIATVVLYVQNSRVKAAKMNVAENLDIHNDKYTFGIDVSHYNGIIDWSVVKESKHPIEFVFVRSTMGKNGVDRRYNENLNGAEKQGFTVGTYHYYRPNENSTEQFMHFKKHAVIKKGHLLPVLDIEEESRYGEENLRKGIKNWLNLAEQEYGVKPIIYTGRVFYRQYLKGHFDDYPLWIASYAPKSKLKGIDWDFHQFSERVNVKGIDGYVDGNDFRGSVDEIRVFCVED
jgi:GH25 family lysozyme M1 (1,4-beta-N-acetylmuramidase)